jgi:hypothetical protein
MLPTRKEEKILRIARREIARIKCVDYLSCCVGKIYSAILIGERALSSGCIINHLNYLARLLLVGNAREKKS